MGRNKASSPGSADGGAVFTTPLYRYAPEIEIRLEDFELYAVHRIRVLKGISDGLSRGKKVNEMETLVKELRRENMKQVDASEVVNKDVISHFVLRHMEECIPLHVLVLIVTKRRGSLLGHFLTGLEISLAPPDLICFNPRTSKTST